MKSHIFQTLTSSNDVCNNIQLFFEILCAQILEEKCYFLQADQMQQKICFLKKNNKIIQTFHTYMPTRPVKCFLSYHKKSTESIHFLRILWPSVFVQLYQKLFTENTNILNQHTGITKATVSFTGSLKFSHMSNVSISQDIFEQKN